MTPEKRLRAAVIVQLLREGWRPPPMTTGQADHLLDTMAGLTRDARGRQPRHDSLELTETERQTLALEAEGLTRDQIAAELERSPETVKDHQNRIRAKLGARNTTHAVALALRQRIIT